MALRCMIMIAAALGAPEPSPVPAVADDAPTIAEKVGKLADNGQHASAAKLAAEGAARADLDNATASSLEGSRASTSTCPIGQVARSRICAASQL